MGPPREHGGMPALRVAMELRTIASMGPPREHGGMLEWFLERYPVEMLQWGRRVNTAECAKSSTAYGPHTASRFNGAAA